MTTDPRLLDLKYLSEYYHKDYRTLVDYMPESPDEYEGYVDFLQTIWILAGDTHGLEPDEMDSLITWAEGNRYGYPTNRLRSSLLPESIEEVDGDS